MKYPLGFPHLLTSFRLEEQVGWKPPICGISGQEMPVHGLFVRTQPAGLWVRRGFQMHNFSIAYGPQGYGNILCDLGNVSDTNMTSATSTFLVVVM